MGPTAFTFASSLVPFAVEAGLSDLDALKPIGENIAWAAGILIAVGVIWKNNWVGRPVKWVWRRLVSEPMTNWSKGVIGSVVEEKISSSAAIGVQEQFEARVDASIQNAIGVMELFQGRVDDSIHDQADFRDDIRTRVVDLAHTSTATATGLENIHSCLDRRFTETQAQIDRMITESSGNRDRIRHMYDIQDAIVFETDASGNFTYFNPAFTLATGLTAEDALGSGWSHLIHPQDQARVFKSWADAHREDRAFTEVFRLRNIFGRNDIAVSATATPLKDALGTPVGWVGAATLLSPEVVGATLDPTTPQPDLGGPRA